MIIAKKEIKCAFVYDILSEEPAQDLKELILRGYHLLPLAADGILVLGEKYNETEAGKC